MIATDLAMRILQDCRGAVGEVRFGFGSKRQVWAFEDRHQLDCTALVGQLAQADPSGFLRLAIEFHDEFAVVSNSWSVRDCIEAQTASLAAADQALFEGAIQGLVDERLALRHWLLAALMNCSSKPLFDGMEAALARVYQPSDQWALLARLEPMAAEQRWRFCATTLDVLAALAQYSAKPADRRRAIEMLAHFGTPATTALLSRAARADTDAAVRDRASQLLRG